MKRAQVNNFSVKWVEAQIYEASKLTLRNAGTGVHDGGAALPALCKGQGGETGAQVLLHNSIISIFMI